MLKRLSNFSLPDTSQDGKSIPPSAQSAPSVETRMASDKAYSRNVCCSFGSEFCFKHPQVRTRIPGRDSTSRRAAIHCQIQYHISAVSNPYESLGLYVSHGCHLTSGDINAGLCRNYSCTPFNHSPVEHVFLPAFPNHFSNLLPTSSSSYLRWPGVAFGFSYCRTGPTTRSS